MSAAAKGKRDRKTAARTFDALNHAESAEMNRALPGDLAMDIRHAANLLEMALEGLTLAQLPYEEDDLQQRISTLWRLASSMQVNAERLYVALNGRKKVAAA